MQGERYKLELQFKGCKLHHLEHDFKTRRSCVFSQSKIDEVETGWCRRVRTRDKGVQSRL